MHAVHMCSVKVMESDTTKVLRYELISSEEHKSAGGLKVKALGQTPRDAGLSPAWHSSFPA